MSLAAWALLSKMARELEGAASFDAGRPVGEREGE
jgi:hypothetical protein